MSDPIEKLCEEYGFNKMLEKKKSSIVSMVRCIFVAYEQFYGKPSSPPTDIIKKVIRTIVEISPEALHLLLAKDADIRDKVLDRVVERIYKIAENELLKQKEIDYIS